MSQLTPTFARAMTTAAHVHDMKPDQFDLLIDAITGAGRQSLEGLSVAHIYNALADHITAMGLRPAEQKLLRIAYWIASSPSG